MNNYKLSVMVSECRQIAELAHAGQKDKTGVDYLYHPLRVGKYAAVGLEHDGRGYGYIAEATGYLHDVFEDTDWTELDVRNYLRYSSPYHAHQSGIDEMLEAVNLLTRTEENKETYYSDIKKNFIARRVKIADIRDNTDPRRLVQLDEKTQLRLIRKYAKALKELQ